MRLAEEIKRLSKEDLLRIARGDIPPTKEMEYCEKHGHVEDKEKRLWTGPRVYCFCRRCDRMYEGTLTIEELTDWQRKLTIHMDI